MEIKRDTYLNKLIDRMGNQSIKVITGLRRCGKSYLLFHLFYHYLLEQNIPEDHIIRIALDDDEHEELLDRKVLSTYIKSLIQDNNTYYIFLDEVQFVDGFEKVLNGLSRLENLDIYVTGSNSKFLSSDILTEFRGRGDEVRVYPLSFSEFVSAYDSSAEEAWYQYVTYGGLPLILTRKTPEQKSKYLIDLMQKVYLDDIIERNQLRGSTIMENLVNILASSIGSLTNPNKLANTFTSNGMGNISDKTISSYIDYLMDSFLISRAERYDVKGKKYISSPYKYYFTDIGLRNARLNFRQQEETHIMENIIYNELLIRGFNVDVGIVEHVESDSDGKRRAKKYEIDFVCNRGNQRYYIQSAFSMPDQEKAEQEQRSLIYTNDFFKKIIVVKDNIVPWHNELGILIIGLKDFLLKNNSLEL
ncbi:MAG TPA: AAA family ATPase [Lachnospiraceae bacterium]|nr:AAA family ATPase [Lachnospiraceae bacterium]